MGPPGPLATGEPPAASLDGGTRILLVRHGVTEFTVSGRVDGRGGADPPLTDRGKAQAAAVAPLVAQRVRDLPVTVTTSSLQRCRATAATVADGLGVPVHVDPDWDEQALGAWDGLTLAQLHERDPAALARLRRDAAYRPPGGESRADVTARVERAVGRATTRGGTVVVATSRVPILVVLGRVLGIAPERFWALSTDPGSVSVVDVWPDGELSVAVVNALPGPAPVQPAWEPPALG